MNTTISQVNKSENVKQNFYPQFPMQLSPFCELEMKTNNTFAKNFEVKKVEPSEEEKEEISNNKNNENGQVIKELNLDDIFGINTTHIQRYNNIIQHPLYDVFVKIPGKMWKIKVQTEDGTTLYGPFMTEFIYNFIGKYYEKWEDEHPEMLNGITILVFDIVSDVQYYSDEPHANLSAVPLYYLSKLARKDVKVVLLISGSIIVSKLL